MSLHNNVKQASSAHRLFAIVGIIGVAGCGALPDPEQRLAGTWVQVQKLEQGGKPFSESQGLLRPVESAWYLTFSGKQIRISEPNGDHVLTWEKTSTRKDNLYVLDLPGHQPGAGEKFVMVGVGPDPDLIRVTIFHDLDNSRFNSGAGDYRRTTSPIPYRSGSPGGQDTATLIQQLGGTVNRMGPPDNRIKVNFGGHPVSDEAIDASMRIRDMTELVLDGTRVTDAGVRRLKEAPKLMLLGLVDTSVTDAALNDISAIKQLSWVYLKGSKVTPNGIRQLRRQRPDVKVFFGPFSGLWALEDNELAVIFDDGEAIDIDLVQSDQHTPRGSVKLARSGTGPDAKDLISGELQMFVRDDPWSKQVPPRSRTVKVFAIKVVDGTKFEMMTERVVWDPKTGEESTRKPETIVFTRTK